MPLGSTPRTDPTTPAVVLVHVASFVLAEGESSGELAARFPAARLGQALASVPFVRDDGRPATVLYIRQEEFRAVSASDVFAADVDAAVAGAMAVTQRPIVAEALEEEATRAAWRTVPSWTLVTTRDLAVRVASQRSMAERASSRAVEVDASHAVTVSRPDAVAALVGEAARATAG